MSVHRDLIALINRLWSMPDRNEIRYSLAAGTVRIPMHLVGYDTGRNEIVFELTGTRGLEVMSDADPLPRM